MTEPATKGISAFAVTPPKGMRLRVLLRPAANDNRSPRSRRLLMLPALALLVVGAALLLALA